MTPVIETKNLFRTYNLGGVSVRAVRGISLTVAKGEYIAITGHSGSGKSTLMYLIGCLDRPTDGEVWIEGKNTALMSSNELALLRNRKIGFVFQNFNLLPRLNALANVETPLIYAGIGKKERVGMAMASIEMVGLKERAMHKSTELSGGEQQRVAIARAMVSNPEIILADEPTGNLDTLSGAELMVIFETLNQKGITLVIVTHEPDVYRHARRIIIMRDGRVSDDRIVETPKSPFEAIEEIRRTAPKEG